MHLKPRHFWDPTCLRQGPGINRTIRYIYILHLVIKNIPTSGLTIHTNKTQCYSILPFIILLSRLKNFFFAVSWFIYRQTLIPRGCHKDSSLCRVDWKLLGNHMLNHSHKKGKNSLETPAVFSWILILTNNVLQPNTNI